MDLQLDGKVFLVTGASAGIGAATVRTLAAEGATVVGIARSTEGIEALGARVSAVAADMTDPQAPERVIAYLLSPLAGQVTGAEWAVDGGALRQI